MDPMQMGARCAPNLGADHLKKQFSEAMAKTSALPPAEIAAAADFLAKEVALAQGHPKLNMTQGEMVAIIMGQLKSGNVEGAKRALAQRLKALS